MSFFIRKAGGGSRPQPRLKGGKKRVGSSTKANHTNKKSKVVSKSRHVDEIVSSESEAENDVVLGRHHASEDEEELETEQEKKLRLAKKYLAEIERQEKEKLDAQEVDRSVVSHRLRTDLLEQSGQLHKKIADNVQGVDKERMLVLKGHKLPVTCVTVSQDGQHIFSGSKDCAIIKWCAKTGKKLFTVPGAKKNDAKSGHGGHVLAISISSDGMYLASGCQLKMIFIRNPSTMQQLHIFQGHRGPVMGLAFRTGSHQLYSCSADRSVKVWNLDEMAYVETLFGHQDAVTAIDSYTRERAVTAGSRDNTLRVWKIPEESQLVYQSHNCSVDCAKMINEQHFVSGADDGSLSLWSALKKKPTSVHHQAHGSQDGAPRWITAVASLRCTDLIASGSWNGEVKLWSSGDECKKLKEVASIPVEGFVNALVFNSSGDVLVAAVGQEHRLGRWWKLKEARNCVIVLPLIFKDV
uniref:U3 small nucleolar RNA-interacting protein 2 n=1 Tax=Rhipicephalus microplus TaxID=6941 RepID=A0A6M2CW88_RHIMP